MFIHIRLDVLCLVTPKPNSEGWMDTHLYTDYLYKDQCVLLFGVFFVFEKEAQQASTKTQ